LKTLLLGNLNYQAISRLSIMSLVEQSRYEKRIRFDRIDIRSLGCQLESSCHNSFL